MLRERVQAHQAASEPLHQMPALVTILNQRIEAQGSQIGFEHLCKSNRRTKVFQQQDLTGRDSGISLGLTEMQNGDYASIGVVWFSYCVKPLRELFKYHIVT